MGVPNMSDVDTSPLTPKPCEAAAEIQILSQRLQEVMARICPGKLEYIIECRSHQLCLTAFEKRAAPNGTEPKQTDEQPTSAAGSGPHACVSNGDHGGEG